MTSHQVSLEQMEFVRGEMDNITRQIKQTLADLDDTTQQHLSRWSCDARAAYYAAQQQWDTATQKMAAELQTATTAVGDISEYYASGEKYGLSLGDR